MIMRTEVNVRYMLFCLSVKDKASIDHRSYSVKDKASIDHRR